LRRLRRLRYFFNGFAIEIDLNAKDAKGAKGAIYQSRIILSSQSRFGL